LNIRNDSPKCYLQLETSLDLKELTYVELFGSRNSILAESLCNFFLFSSVAKNGCFPESHSAYDSHRILSDQTEIFITDTWGHSLEVASTISRKLVFFLFFETTKVKVLVKNQNLKVSESSKSMKGEVKNQNGRKYRWPHKESVVKRLLNRKTLPTIASLSLFSLIFQIDICLQFDAYHRFVTYQQLYTHFQFNPMS